MLSGVADSDVHLFVADVIKSFDTVDRGILDKVLSSLGLPGWFLTLSTIRMFGFGSNWLLGLVSLGLGMVVFLRGAL